MQISANGITLEVEDHGPTSGEPLLLIMGLGMQLVAWHEGLVQQLVGQGFRVIRFDNRDAGLSQSFDAQGVPNIALASMQYLFRMRVKAPYSLADMARDAVGVLDALNINKAHVCGASMGGMIAQHLGISHAERVKSLTLIMTTSGARALPQPTMKVRQALLTRPSDPKDFASIAQHYFKLYRLIGSPGFPAPEPWLRQRIEASVRRSNRPRGVARQLVAIAADAGRAAQLGQISAPTHIIHGEADPLVPVAAAHDLKKRIAGATVDLIAGMGHDLPEPLWPRFAAGIKETSTRAV
ncbi:alpha/beta hydrolase [soil metagenome]